MEYGNPDFRAQRLKGCSDIVPLYVAELQFRLLDHALQAARDRGQEIILPVPIRRV